MRVLTPREEQQLRHAQVLDKLTAIEENLPHAILALIQYLDGKVTKTEVINNLKSISTPDVKGVVDAIQKLDTRIANKNLDLTPVVSGLKDLDKQFATLESAIKQIQLTAEAPKVDVQVPKPQVLVQEANLLPLRTAITDVLKAIQAIKIPALPEIPKTDLSSVEKRLSGLAEWLAVLDKNTKDANKNLKKLIDKPQYVSSSSGGGGGGSAVGSGAQSTGQVTIATTATSIIGARPGRQGVVLITLGGNPVFLGNSDVTASTGLFLSGNEGASIYIPTTAALYGITTINTQVLSFMEVY